MVGCGIGRHATTAKAPDRANFPSFLSILQAFPPLLPFWQAAMKQMLKPFKPGEDRFAGVDIKESEATGAPILPQAASNT